MQVLNDGFVELVDMMGDDQRVLDAARVSTGSTSKGEEQDRKLIEYLMANEHHTPFEKIVTEWHVRCPLFVARQWFRHRIGSFNEQSGRYKQFEFSAFMPQTWRAQDTKNKQGSVSDAFTPDESMRLSSLLREAYSVSHRIYITLLEAGVAKELARSVMPMGIYTEFYWTVNFRSLMNFLKLRTDEHAQPEMREYAVDIAKITKDCGRIPMTLRSFNNWLQNNGWAPIT